MAAAFGAFGNHGVNAGLGQVFGQHGRRDNRDHDDAGFLPFGDILAGVAGAGRDDGHLFLDNNPGEFIGAGVHEHDVDAEGLVGQFTAAADVGAQLVAAADTARADQTERTGVGAGGRKLTGGDVRHTALDNRVFCAKNLIEQFHRKPFPFLFMLLRLC